MTNKQIRTDLEQQIRALPAIKDEHGDDCVSREAVLLRVEAALASTPADKQVEPQAKRILNKIERAIEKQNDPVKCGCDEFPECTHALYWYQGFKAGAAQREPASGELRQAAKELADACANDFEEPTCGDEEMISYPENECHLKFKHIRNVYHALDEEKRLAYNKLNREMGGTLGPYAPPRQSSAPETKPPQGLSFEQWWQQRGFGVFNTVGCGSIARDAWHAAIAAAEREEQK